jgi:thiamine-phosphate pyrophosphorylase
VRLPPHLVGLSPGDLAPQGFPPFLRALERAIAAGLDGLLVREPALEDRALVALLLSVQERLERARAPWLAVHDRAHLALALDARAVHLGWRSLTPAELRPWIGARLALGLSTHERDEPARWSAADYRFYGPVLDTPSKRGLLPAVGFAGLARAVRASQKPVWAIGGLRPEHAPAVRAAGAQGLAVRAGIFLAADAGSAVAGYLEAWT